uniref:RanBP2-type domain-containing protein n=1 Tax=Lygus hesperus TaxID=30085 RepID=A0A146KVZ9_LYGHE
MASQTQVTKPTSTAATVDTSTSNHDGLSAHAARLLENNQWQCDACSYINHGMTPSCEICETPNPLYHLATGSAIAQGRGKPQAGSSSNVSSFASGAGYSGRNAPAQDGASLNSSGEVRPPDEQRVER